VFRECSESVQRVFRESLDRRSRVFRTCLESVLRVFRECLRACLSVCLSVCGACRDVGPRQYCPPCRQLGYSHPKTDTAGPPPATAGPPPASQHHKTPRTSENSTTFFLTAAGPDFHGFSRVLACLAGPNLPRFSKCSWCSPIAPRWS
jgi:hypothetical protein